MYDHHGASYMEHVNIPESHTHSAPAVLHPPTLYPHHHAAEPTTDHGWRVLSSLLYNFFKVILKYTHVPVFLCKCVHVSARAGPAETRGVRSL